MSDWKETRLNCVNCDKCLTRSGLRRHRLKGSCVDRRLSGPHGYRAERKKRLLVDVDTTVMHNCTACDRRFEWLASLKRHSRLKHPELVKKGTHEQTKGNIQCGHCVERSFSSVIDLCYHVSRHSDHWEADGNISGYSLLSGAFGTVDEFVAWKERLQATSGVYLVTKRGAVRLKKSNQLVSYFYCSNPKSACRNKEIAAKNQHWYCTAFVKAVQQENGSVTVLYCPDHYMHSVKYRRQQQLPILQAPTPLSEEDDLRKRFADDNANVVVKHCQRSGQWMSEDDVYDQQPLSADNGQAKQRDIWFQSQSPPTLVLTEPNQFDNLYGAGDEDFTTQLQENTRGILLETLHLVREATQPSSTNKRRRETLERIYEAAAAVRDLAQDLLCDEDVAVR